MVTSEVKNENVKGSIGVATTVGVMTGENRLRWFLACDEERGIRSS